jgi:predicted DCC family thiol-disulfide oxidoreductase YuxK
MKVSSLPRALIIIDGQCLFCNHWSQFICKFDIHYFFKFTQAQSELGQEVFEHFNLSKDLSSIIFIFEGSIYIESTAVINILSKLHPGLKWMFVLKFIPLIIRDSAYKIIAKYRYHFFGKSETCVLLNENQKSRFLS